MKKKLTIKSERIRNLTLTELARAAGGSYASCPPTIGAACVTVYNCTVACATHVGCTSGGGGGGSTTLGPSTGCQTQ